MEGTYKEKNPHMDRFLVFDRVNTPDYTVHISTSWFSGTKALPRIYVVGI